MCVRDPPTKPVALFLRTRAPLIHKRSYDNLMTRLRINLKTLSVNRAPGPLNPNYQASFP